MAASQSSSDDPGHRNNHVSKLKNTPRLVNPFLCAQKRVQERNPSRPHLQYVLSSQKPFLRPSSRTGWWCDGALMADSR